MKIINKKEFYHLNDILDDDFFNMRENRLIPLSQRGGFGEKIDRVELAEYMIELTNSALVNLAYNAQEKGVRLPIPILSLDIKPDELSDQEGQWTYYELKVKVGNISDHWDSFDKGIVSEDD
mgnify:FL=1